MLFLFVFKSNAVSITDISLVSISVHCCSSEVEELRRRWLAAAEEEEEELVDKMVENWDSSRIQEDRPDNLATRGLMRKFEQLSLQRGYLPLLLLLLIVM